MSLAQSLRTAAQHDDWSGYVCPVMNKVLTAYLVPGVDVPPAPREQLRTYMLLVADALDGGTSDGVALPGEAYGTQALGRGFFNAEPAKCKTCGGTWSQHDAKGRCPSGVAPVAQPQPLAEAARVLAEFARTAPGRLPSRVQEALAVADGVSELRQQTKQLPDADGGGHG